MSPVAIVVASLLCIVAFPQSRSATPLDTRSQTCRYCKALDAVMHSSSDPLSASEAIEATCSKFPEDKMECRVFLVDSRDAPTDDDTGLWNGVFKVCRSVCVAPLVEMTSSPSVCYDCYRIVRATIAQLKGDMGKSEIRDAVMKMCSKISIGNRMRACYMDVTVDMDKEPFELWRTGILENVICGVYSVCRSTEKTSATEWEWKQLGRPSTGQPSVPVAETIKSVEGSPAEVGEELPWFLDISGMSLRPVGRTIPEASTVVAGGRKERPAPVIWWTEPPEPSKPQKVIEPVKEPLAKLTKKVAIPPSLSEPLPKSTSMDADLDRMQGIRNVAVKEWSTSSNRPSSTVGDAAPSKGLSGWRIRRYSKKMQTKNT